MTRPTYGPPSSWQDDPFLPRPVEPPPPDYQAIQASPEFADLRRRLRRFVFPMTALFLGWYLAFVLLAAYLPELMSRRVYGTITVGLLLGVAQFVSTLLITTWYVRFARKRIDPRVAEIRRAAGQDTGLEDWQDPYDR